MKHLALALFALVALAGPSFAQYYDPYYGPGPGWNRPPPPPPGWRPPPPPQPGWGPPPGQRWRQQQQRRQMGNVCVTSRGSCEYPQYFPRNTPCRCDIPGFGTKRGAIGY
ncbi:hypothetical protein [Microvirga flavescens]|uniref:hypothetical protein n=1 Tax=Microvirga flavescens TaxID=2249811 RepID=UPI000DD76406|nr:hypothetical protein [Microvirga flavescens]